MELYNHISIPDIGLGVYKMAHGDEMNNAVAAAYDLGYRLFDTAQMYKNEDALGDAIKGNNISRDDIFIVSKVDNCNQWYENTLKSFDESLSRLKTDYLDSFLIHWPGQNNERMLSTWQAMEKLYSDGKVKSIGVCNFEVSQLEYLLSHCTVKPMINQIEHTPLSHNENLLSLCRDNSIAVMAWAPLLRGNFNNKTILDIADKHSKSPAQILLRWNIQQGIIPIPKSKNPTRLAENISVFDFELDDNDMQALNSMNQNRRTSHDPLVFDFWFSR